MAAVADPWPEAMTIGTDGPPSVSLAKGLDAVASPALSPIRRAAAGPAILDE